MYSSSSDESLCLKRAETGPGGTSTRGKWRRTRKSRPPSDGNDAVKMKVQKLKKLVPGGDDLKTEGLLSRTADYIVHMRIQVNLLQTLLKLHRHHPPDGS
ncbi:hypothetical protein MLD38_021826 [Melastoma candidum]|uniref:Uncharacterized protein n=1 Tax=Melastoma candidum TaxID=119954 RepID=A0ACB9QHJ1_9MYRT|nr:hypothetical protein MLD38_021826 [Melastoma candidum]